MSKVDDDDEVKPMRMILEVEEEVVVVEMDKNMFVVELVVHWDREILVVVV